MSLKEVKQEAEAVLDSAEMVLETIPEPRTGKAKELELKLSELEKEIQEPEDERTLEKLIEDVRELMNEAQEDAMQDEPALGPEDEMGMGPEGPPPGPEDDVPHF